MAKPDGATLHSRELHGKACCDPLFDWEDRQDFEFAERGLIHRPDDPAILDAEGLWCHANEPINERVTA